jgi:glycosyltransferase involved in cell wall biosynthesis
MKLISVIIPAHNVEKYIKKCLTSVFNQTYKNIEIILIDDFSTDRTIKIAKTFQKKYSNLKIIRLVNYGLKRRSGISTARNLGIRLAKGEFIALLDGDDLWSEEKLDLQINLIKDKILCFTNVEYLYEEPKDFFQKTLRFFINFISKTFFIKHLSFTNNISPSSVLIKKKVFKNLKFGKDFESQGIEDIDMWLRIDRKYPDSFVYLNKRVTKILRRKNSVSANYIIQYVRNIQLYSKNFLITKDFKDFNKFLIGTIIRFIFLFLKNNYRTIKRKTIISLFSLIFFYFIIFHSSIIYHINKKITCQDQIEKVDLIVVFSGSGSTQYFNNTYQLRYKETLELYNQGLSNYILLYGRVNFIPEAQIIKSLLINDNIKSNKIKLINDNGSEFKNTYDLIKSINAFILGENINSIILVASPEVQLRLKLIWFKINPKTKVLCYSSKSFYLTEKYNVSKESFFIIIKELATLIYYKFIYKI